MKFEVTITKKDLKELNSVLADMDSADEDDESPNVLRELFFVEALGHMRGWDIRDRVGIKRIK